MEHLICTIADAIHGRIPEIKKSVYLAKIDDDGRVLVRDTNSNEYQFAGIHDQDSAWFYIRFRNDGRIEYQSPKNSLHSNHFSKSDTNCALLPVYAAPNHGNWKNVYGRPS
jgi:hypothetical protein